MPEPTQATRLRLTVGGMQTFVILAALATALLAYLGSLPAVVVRYLFLATFLFQLALQLSRRDVSFLKSPALLFAAVSGFGYSVIPAGVIFIMENGYLPTVVLDSLQTIISKPSWLTYFGHQSELFVLAFAAGLLSVHGVVQTNLNNHAPPRPIPLTPIMENALAGASLILSAFTALAIASDSSDIAVGLITRTVAPPLHAVILLLLTHQYLTKRINLPRLLAVLIVAVACLIWQQQAKIPFFIIVSIGLYAACVRRISTKHMLAMIIGICVSFVLIMQIAQTLRNPAASIASNDLPAIKIAVEVIYQKAIWRQVGTGNCLRGVVERHRDNSFPEGDHLFWARALVPRVLWPNKENLSLGSQYAIDYCGSPVNQQHSASITLLGQPIIKTGELGLLLHAGILLAGIGVLTSISQRSHGLWTAYVMSLLPWWIDFDQDFALYVAHIVKFSLIMGLILIPIVFITKRNAQAPPGPN